MSIFRHLKRVLKPDGSFWLNIGDTYVKKNLMGIPWRVALALQDDGWILRNAVVWDKMKGSPDNAKDKLRNVHEELFHFVLQPTYYYDVDAIRNEPGKPYYRDGRIVTPTGVSGAKYEQQIRKSKVLSETEKEAALAALADTLRKVEAGELPDFRMVIRGTQRSTHSDSTEYSGRASELKAKGFAILPYHKNGTKPGDIWHIIPEDQWRKDGHYAVFPLDLCELPIKATCPVGGIVLDPFAGTGTALVEAVMLGRRGIGIDSSRSYLSEAEKRLARVCAEQRQRVLAQGGLFDDGTISAETEKHKMPSRVLRKARQPRKPRRVSSNLGGATLPIPFEDLR
jgi:site-specific DNA-methyltransferase (adenine-specific)